MDTNEVLVVRDGERVARDPFNRDEWHPVANTEAFIGSTRSRLKERREQFAAITANAAAPIEAVKKLRRDIEADDKALKDFDANFKEALLSLSGFKAFVVQTRGAGKSIDPTSVRGAFAEMVAALKEREDAAKPPMPTHTYFYAVTATDAGHARIARAISKEDEGFGIRRPQSEREFKQLEKIFASAE